MYVKIFATLARNWEEIRGNERKKRKWREGEKMEREEISLSPFPFSLQFLFLSISSFSLHFLAAPLPGCRSLWQPVAPYIELNWAKLSYISGGNTEQNWWGYNELHCNTMHWAAVVRVALSSNQLHWYRLNWATLSYSGTGCIELHWWRLNWVTLSYSCTGCMPH